MLLLVLWLRLGRGPGRGRGRVSVAGGYDGSGCVAGGAWPAAWAMGCYQATPEAHEAALALARAHAARRGRAASCQSTAASSAS